MSRTGHSNGEQTAARPPSFSLVTRVYLVCVIGLGAYSLLTSFRGRFSEDLPRFFVYLIISIFASLMKVSLPNIRGNLSVNFYFFLVFIIQLTRAETLVIGLAATLAQTLWKSQGRRIGIRTLFNLGLIAWALAVAYDASAFAGAFKPAIGLPVRHVLTATIYFIVNTAPVAIAIHLTEQKSFYATWRDTYFWAFPYYLLGAGFAWAYGTFGIEFGWQSAILILPVVYAIYRSFSYYLLNLESQKNQAELQRNHAEQVSNLHLRTIQALALAIEAKDQTTHEHLQRVQVYSLELADALGASEDEIQALRAAALLHDIGKLAVPEHIISKPGRLTPEEFEKMKIHPVVGAEILEHVQFPYPVVPIVRHHHEKWDGSGYPDGIKGEDIPLGARILATVDCLDALASDRQYRRALPLDQAMAEVQRLAGSSFDPRVVETLSRNYLAWEEKARGQAPDARKLSTDIRVERGAPAAGFQGSNAAAAESGPDAPKPVDFLTAIGAARHEAQTLHEMTQDMISYLSLDEMLSVVAVRLKKLIPHDAFAVYLSKDEVLIPQFVTGDDFRLFNSLRIPKGKGLSGWVAENRMAILNGNPSVEPEYLKDKTKFSTLSSALSVPLESGTSVLGAITLYHAAKDAFSPDHLRVLLMTASKLAQSVQNSLQYKTAADISLTDYLTGLPNARSLFNRLGEEIKLSERAGSIVSVLVCDLDGFKAINDRFGHLSGNHVLQRVGKALKEHCRPDDYVARMGGDEFVLVVRDLHPGSATIISRITEAVEAIGVEICKEKLLSVSIGFSVSPEDGVEPETLLAAADQMMYRNKETRRHGRVRQQLLQVAAAIEHAPAGAEIEQPAG